MDPCQNNPFVDGLYCLRGMKDICESLPSLEKGQKVGIDEEGRFFLSWGTNDIIGRPFQAAHRAACNFFTNCDATAADTKIHLQEVREKAFGCVTRLYTTTEKECKGAPLVRAIVKREFAIFNRAAEKAHAKISILSETYGKDKDEKTVERMKYESVKYGEMVKVVAAKAGEQGGGLPDISVQFIDDLCCLRDVRAVYRSMPGLTEGQKIGVDEKGHFFLSWGTNGILGWPIQVVHRTACNYFTSSEATATATKVRLQEVRELGSCCIERLVSFVEKECRGSPFIIDIVKKELENYSADYQRVQAEISTLPKTYRDEKTVRRMKGEVEKGGEMVAMIAEGTEKLATFLLATAELQQQGAVASPLPPRERAILSSSNSTHRSSPSMITPEKLAELFNGTLQTVFGQEKVKMRDNFRGFFTGKCTLEEAKAVKAIRNGKPEEVSEDSRIGQARELWERYLSDEHMKNEDVQSAFDNGLSDAIKEMGEAERLKELCPEVHPSTAASRDSVLQELRKVQAQRNQTSKKD